VYPTVHGAGRRALRWDAHYDTGLFIDADQHGWTDTMLRTISVSDREHLPGEHAPATGHYEELNVFGSPTGVVHHAREGKRLPAAPHGFTWRPAEVPC
jgi:hypothetical protein